MMKMLDDFDHKQREKAIRKEKKKAKIQKKGENTAKEDNQSTMETATQTKKRKKARQQEMQGCNTAGEKEAETPAITAAVGAPSAEAEP